MLKLVLEGQTRSSTSAADMKIHKADARPHAAVTWAISVSASCVGGCRSGAAFFTVVRVLSHFSKTGAFEGSDQKCVCCSGNSYQERKNWLM